MTTTLHHEAAIAEAIVRLAVACGAGVLDETTNSVYLDGLSGFAPEVVERVCRGLASEPTPRYGKLPELGILVAKCRETQVKLALVRALPAVVEEADRTYRCHLCQDEPNGLRLFRCPEVSCGRAKAHAPHPYVARCRCWFWKHGEAIKFLRQDAEQHHKPISPAMREVEAFEAGKYPWATEVAS